MQTCRQWEWWKKVTSNSFAKLSSVLRAAKLGGSALQLSIDTSWRWYDYFYLGEVGGAGNGQS